MSIRADLFTDDELTTEGIPMSAKRSILFLVLLFLTVPALAQQPVRSSGLASQPPADDSLAKKKQIRDLQKYYEDKVLCTTEAAGRRTTRVVAAGAAQRLRCTSITPLSGMQVDPVARIVRFRTRPLSFQQMPGATLSCKDPDGDFEHCNSVCSSVPQTPESGSTGCSLGCLAAYIWDGIWCD